MAKRAASQQKSLFSRDASPATPLRPATPSEGETRPSPDESSSLIPHPSLPPGSVAPLSAPASLAGQSVWVVDAHSLIHQVFHAIPNMTSPSGQPVNAVYGFTRDLFNLLETKQPDFLFCAFDLPGRTFRHEIYEQYKAGRPEMHEDLLPQFAFVHAWSRRSAFPCWPTKVSRPTTSWPPSPGSPTSWAGSASSSREIRTAGN